MVSTVARWYNTGTVSVTNGSDLIVGVDTQWLGNVEPGFEVRIQNVGYELLQILSPNSIQLAKQYVGSTANDLPYDIIPTQAYALNVNKNALEYLDALNEQVEIGFSVPADDSISNSKLSNMPPATIKARSLGSSGDPQDITVDQLATMLINGGYDFGGDGSGSGSGSLPSGGTLGQVLAKASDTNGDVEWSTIEFPETFIPEPPADDRVYGRINGAWNEIIPAAFWTVEATGTGSSQQITLPRTDLTVNDIQVFVDSIRYPSSDYTINTNLLVLTTNAGGDKIVINGLTGQTTYAGVLDDVSGGIDPPPSDGKVYGMMNGMWVDITAYLNGVPGSATSKKWRLYVTSHMGGALVAIAELFLFADETPTDVATTGTASQSSQYASYAPAAFLDRTQSSFAALTTSGPLPGWFQVEFATAKSIVGMGVVPRGSELNNSPKNFLLQYENGGVWETLISVQGEHNWVGDVRNDYFESVVFPE